MKVIIDVKSNTPRWHTLMWDSAAANLNEQISNGPDVVGRWINLKKHPERVKELPEIHDWQALGDFILQLNTLPAVITMGCGVCTTERKPYPYVDVSFFLLESDPTRIHRYYHAHLYQMLNGHPSITTLRLDLSEITIPSDRQPGVERAIARCLATRLRFDGGEQQHIDRIFSSIVSATANFVTSIIDSDRFI